LKTGEKEPPEASHAINPPSPAQKHMKKTGVASEGLDAVGQAPRPPTVAMNPAGAKEPRTGETLQVVIKATEPHSGGQNYIHEYRLGTTGAWQQVPDGIIKVGIGDMQGFRGLGTCRVSGRR
jgi:hypothetical protein